MAEVTSEWILLIKKHCIMGRYRENQCRVLCVVFAVTGLALLSSATKAASIMGVTGQGE